MTGTEAGRRVWAPNSSRVDVEIAGERRALRRADDGWWDIQPPVQTDADYAFALDGGDPVPDPRSQWQPHGVRGSSRRPDENSFQWRIDHWAARSVLGQLVYELHIGTFTAEGTFDAAIARLDHVRDLGVDFVELLPVAAFPGRHGWGYDGVFPYAVHEPYGGPAGLKRFVDACHERQMCVVLDVVYNHLGPDGNVLPRFGAYFTDTFSTPWGQAVNYAGPDSDEVRRYVIDNALMWLRDYRFDGLRLDAVHAIIDPSAMHVLEEIAVAVRQLESVVGRPLSLIAESDENNPRIVSARDVGGYGLDAQWSDDFHHALHSVLTGERTGYYEDFGSLSDLATAFAQGFVYAGRYSKHRHRRHGRALPPHVAAPRLLAYAQNHDQIGNRAAGERLAALISFDLAKVAAALVLTSPFTPMLFMGEEWAASTAWQYFTDHEDPDLAEAVRVGRRNEFVSFGWRPDAVPDPQDPQTVRRSTLDWEELRGEPHAEMLRWHRALIALRRERPDLTNGSFGDVRIDEVTRVLAMARGSTLVVANLSGEHRHVPVDAKEVLLASAAATLADGVLAIPRESVAILAR